MTVNYSTFFSKIALRRRGNLIRQITEIYLNSNNPNAINFAGGMPNTNTYPFKELDVIYKDGTNSKLEGQDLALALQYGPAVGYLPLIKKFREFQYKWHKPKQKNWDVIFTCGSQDACTKIYEMFIDEGDPIMVQSPTYTATINTLASLNVDFIEINQDVDGIIPEEIIKVYEERLRDGRLLPKLIYINPTGANPTGTILSESRRKQVYELAQKYNFLIIEDDAYYFINFLNKQLTSFFSLDIDGRVIRLDSFSKIISAGMRLGCVTANTELLKVLMMHIENSVLQASSLSQIFLFKLLDLWGQERFNQHLKSIQDFYLARRNIMLKGIEKHLTGLVEWTEPKGGFFIWLKLIGIDDASNFVKDKCMSNGIFVIPGNVFNYDFNKPDQHIRLSYSYGTEEEIERGLSKLAELIHKVSK
ncbi:aromatic amino acid aminotransferase DDB_G0287711-like [Vespa mandarinia]|uniref:aromatic amino acid aminotransferase DDB_G0287711-like n=1 Tax=Vespa mandarinia TaxID=7446 RepID=UPI00162223D9|nr:aromatic amino acid aminotransferase DDB_G0287711-like [Vespa mandarinia]